MNILFFGILTLVAFMVAVIGIPIVQYMKRERQWEETGRTFEAWYR